MKFTKSIQVLTVILFVAVNLSQVWASFNSVSFADNGTVYHQSGATQEEANTLASYLEAQKVDNADFKLQRDSESNTLVLSMIPAASTTSGDLRAIGHEIEQNVFGEKVIVAACDDEFHELYRVNK
jgi:hypothetical protein